MFRTLSGAIAVAALLCLALAFLVLAPAPVDIVIPDSRSAIEHFYLSALQGQLLRVDEDGEETELAPGEGLLPGRSYRCRQGSVALVRSNVDGFATVLYPGSRIRLGDEVDDRVPALTAGSAHLDLRDRASGEPFNVEAGGHLLRLEPPSDLQLTLEGDHLLLEVFGGAVTLESEDGERFEAGTSARIYEDRVAAAENALLPAPVITQPRSGSVFLKEEDATLAVNLSWLGTEGASRYLVEIARNLLFHGGAGGEFVQKYTSDISFPLVVSSEGRYYWRVRAIGRDATPGQLSRPMAITVRAAERGSVEIPPAPELVVDDVSAQSNLITVRGRTDPGAKVEIHLEANNEILPSSRKVLVAPDGSFRHQMLVYVRGLIDVVVRAYYRPEKVATVIEEVRVDF